MFGGDHFNQREIGFIDPKTEPAKIRAFFVKPEWSRKGIGKKLLLHCETEAKKYGFHRVEMIATLTGVKFYQACGYEEAEPVIYNMPNSVCIKFIPMQKYFTIGSL